VAVDRPPDKQGSVMGLLVPPEPGLLQAAPRVLLSKERGLLESDRAVEGVLADKLALLVGRELVIRDVLTRERVVLVPLVVRLVVGGVLTRGRIVLVD
jgi:hypothetical protein